MTGTVAFKESRLGKTVAKATTQGSPHHRDFDGGWLGTALDASGVVAYDWNLNTGQIAWSDNAAQVLGFDEVDEIATASTFLAKIHGNDFATLGGPGADRGPDGSIRATYRLRRDDGSFCWVQDRGDVKTNGDGEAERFVGTLLLVTDQKTREAKLERLAQHDELTGFYNRGGLRSVLDQAVFDCLRDRSTSAYLAVGIDSISRINETFGYSATDSVIVAVGDRLRESLRLDGALGRVTGNHFGVLLRNCSAEETDRQAAEMLEAVNSRLVDTESGPVPVTISIGGVQLPIAARSGHEAMARAEDALAEAKRAGRDRFVMFSADRDKAADRRRAREIVERVASAAETRALQFAFQPIVEAPGGNVNFYECLIRLLDEDGTPIPAAKFMSVVEDLGLIRKVDRLTLEMAAEELDASKSLELSLNVSGLTVSDRYWLGMAQTLLRDRPEMAERLTIEITETAALRDPEESLRFVSELRRMGCKVALDDFGAGHSSFRQLRDLAVDVIKIDGSFVRGVSDCSDNKLLVKTLLELAQGFHLSTVAEWVENPEDARFLVDLGVDFLQGYLFGAPSLERPWLLSSAIPTIHTVPGVPPHEEFVRRIRRGLTG